MRPVAGSTATGFCVAWARCLCYKIGIMFSIQPVTLHDAEQVRAFTIEHWGAPVVVVHGHVYEPHTLPGFIAVQDEEWIGLVSYHIAGDACEVVTLNSMREGVGVGTALIAAVVEKAKRCGCRRVWLITTNDNLHAVRFYQKRGFRLVAIHRDAVERSRQIKPEIPLISNDGIPLRDEIELEMSV